MRISIFGLGYVGLVSSACLARLGHEIIGVDVNPKKVDLVNAGLSPIVEDELADLVRDAVRAGRLRASHNVGAAVSGSDVSFISVGTPSTPDGAPSLVAVDKVVEEIGRALRSKDGPHTVVLRSTVLPGTTERRVAPALARHSGRKIGENLEVCFNPEFLREGSAVKDFYQPPFTIGAGLGGDGGRAVFEEIYGELPAPLIHTTCRTAESVKYLCNVFHAVKVAFANEAGSLLKSVGIDAREALEIFCRDQALNISPAYLRPGYAFGGPCLPKDLRAFLALARENDLELPFLSQLLPSNRSHIERALGIIARSGRRRVALFGLAFKRGTDDVRESPLVALAERLLGRGFELTIHDPDVRVGRLIGANREFINQEIMHLEQLLAPDPVQALEGAEVVVVGHAGPEEVEAIAAAPRRPMIVDLCGVPELRRLRGGDGYEGICW